MTLINGPGETARPQRWALLVAGAAALALWVTYVWAVLTPGGQDVDNRAMLVADDLLTGRQWPVALLELISPSTVLLAAAVLTTLAAIARGGRVALAVGVTATVTALTAQILKERLTRPPLLGEAAGNSWPSGHVAAVAGLAVAAVLAVPPAMRVLMGALGLAAVTLTGLATVALHWHRPSDVVAALLLAAAVGGVAVFATSARGPALRDL